MHRDTSFLLKLFGASALAGACMEAFMCYTNFYQARDALSTATPGKRVLPPLRPELTAQAFDTPNRLVRRCIFAFRRRGRSTRLLLLRGAAGVDAWGGRTRVAPACPAGPRDDPPTAFYEKARVVPQVATRNAAQRYAEDWERQIAARAQVVQQIEERTRAGKA